ncbi:mycothiol synthase [Corynebacterium sp. 4HC-13]|uniref:Mycothiol acetyltransferase n=2 Tax=Corynebacterium anserum TaxID=2684406 RepID=A0A7G7YQU7_9CORY|nr:mycothiol synthase [Corynebacterium anserum]QNH96867.1 mycothiol synthase [Corynebacterium anserum]
MIFTPFEDLHAHPAVVEKVMGLLAEVRDYDDVAALGEAFVRGIEEDHDYRHVIASEGEIDSGEVVGIIALDTNRTLELAVSPSRRHHGIGRALFEEIARAFDLEGAVDVWAHGDSPSAQKLVEVMGGRRTRELLKMAVKCAPGSGHSEHFLKEEAHAWREVEDQDIEVLTYPQAVEKYGEEFVDEEWVRVNNEAFAWHPEQGGWDIERLVSARDTSWYRPDGVWMLWTTDEINGESRCMGVHWTKLPLEEREKPSGERTGEVYVVCLANEARGKGLGGPMTLIGMGSLLHEGVGVIELYVEGDNAPAVATYRRLGFEVVHTDVVYRGLLAPHK